MTLGLMKDAANVVLIRPNGVGKPTLAKNVAHQALVHGHTVLFTTAGNTCWANWPRSIAIQRCAGACVAMLRPTSL